MTKLLLDQVPKLQRCSCSCGCCYKIFKVLKLFISQPIVIKLRIETEDNILHNCAVSDYQVSPNLLIIIFNHQVAYTQQHHQQRRRRQRRTTPGE